MRLIKSLRTAFSMPQGIPVNTEQTKKDSDRRIVELHSNGNIRLQRGQYSTKAEIDTRYERIKNYDFEQ